MTGSANGRAEGPVAGGVGGDLVPERDQGRVTAGMRDAPVELVEQVRSPHGKVADARGESSRVQAEPDHVQRRLEQTGITAGEQYVDGLVGVDDVNDIATRYLDTWNATDESVLEAVRTGSGSRRADPAAVHDHRSLSCGGPGWNVTVGRPEQPSRVTCARTP